MREGITDSDLGVVSTEVPQVEREGKKRAAFTPGASKETSSPLGQMGISLKNRGNHTPYFPSKTSRPGMVPHTLEADGGGGRDIATSLRPA